MRFGPVLFWPTWFLANVLLWPKWSLVLGFWLLAICRQVLYINSGGRRDNGEVKMRYCIGGYICSRSITAYYVMYSCSLLLLWPKHHRVTTPGSIWPVTFYCITWPSSFRITPHKSGRFYYYYYYSVLAFSLVSAMAKTDKSGFSRPLIGKNISNIIHIKTHQSKRLQVIMVNLENLLISLYSSDACISYCTYELMKWHNGKISWKQRRQKRTDLEIVASLVFCYLWVTYFLRRVKIPELFALKNIQHDMFSCTFAAFLEFLWSTTGNFLGQNERDFQTTENTLATQLHKPWIGAE